MNIFVATVIGSLGALSRVLFQEQIVQKFFSKKYWISTLTINLLGAFILGIFVSLQQNNQSSSESLWEYIIVAFLGSFTTLSAILVDCTRIIKQNKKKLAFLYILCSFMGGIILFILPLLFSNNLNI